MERARRIAILGAGSWGSALAMVLARNGHEVRLWGKNPDTIARMHKERENRRYLPGFSFLPGMTVFSSLAQAIHENNDILISVPSHAFLTLLKEIAPFLREGQGLTWATKGLDPSARFLHEIVEEVVGQRPMALLTGPSFAREVAENLPTAVVVASNSADYAKVIQGLFQAAHFRVYTSDDLVGAEIGGAVKNVMALAVGIAEGLGFRTNTKAALMTRGLSEMMRLGEALGAKRETLTGLAGLGDLILTCSDQQSRNLRLGIMLGEGVALEAAYQKIGQAVESILTTDLLFRLARKHGVRMPIVNQVYAILYQALSPERAILNLIEKEPHKE